MEVNDTTLAETTFVIVDLETTGGSPKNGCSITEIGAVKVQGGELLGEFKSFVNPLSPIPGYITDLTGITNEMVATAPIIDEALPEFLAFCGSSNSTVLVAHNAPFDMGFLKAAAEEIEIPWPEFRVLDTARLARIVLGRDEVPNCKLGTLSQFFNTEVKPTHRALDDAQTTTEILYRLFERFGSLGITTTNDLIKKSSKRISRPRYQESQVHWQVREEFAQYQRWEGEITE
jgi:DNA polymerase III epsilon subunit family exonuclease